MKKFAKLIMAVMLMVSMAACASEPAEDGIYTAGTYTGTAAGRNGEITVEVTVSADKIETVTVTDHVESAGIADPAIEGIPTAIVEAQSTEVDLTSGATITAEAIVKAVENALAAARGEEVLSNAAERDTEADVIVVGAGGAGLAAAATATEAGAEVIVLEVNAYAGGAMLSSGGFFSKVDEAALAEADRNDADLDKYASYKAEDFPEEYRNDLATLQTQIEEYKNNGLEKGAFYSIERVMIDHYLKAEGTDLDGTEATVDYALIRAALDDNMVIFNWMAEAGLVDEPSSLIQTKASGGGKGFMDPLLKLAEKADIQYEVRGTELIVTDGKVTGVKAIDKDGNEITYTATNGVILATGGFASNIEMVSKYQRLGEGLGENTPSNDPESLQGDGIIMAEAIGAQLRDMSFITTRMKGYQNLSTTGEADVPFAAGQLAVNTSAVRFVDESSESNIQDKAGVHQEDGIIYMIGDAKMLAAMEEKSAGLAADLIERGMAFQADTIEDLAATAGLDAATLASTIETFNGYVDAESDADFARTKFNGKVEEGPYYAAKLQMAYHLTFGGLVADEFMHVLDTEGNPISGLYAAGDILSGFEGDVHQGGPCLTIVFYAGREAGTNVATGK